MIIFIFPKQFEFNLFLISIRPRIIIIRQLIKIENTFLILYTYKNKNIFCLCILINNSDIKFNLILNNIIDQLKADFADIELGKRMFDWCQFILIGTCGGDIIGNVYQTKTAIKYDKGELKIGNIFVQRKEKELTINDKFDDRLFVDIIIEKRKIMSGNLLVHFNFIQDDNVVFDMETYDFYSICNYKSIKNYTTFRIVSDTFEIKEDYFKNLNKNCLLLEQSDDNWVKIKTNNNYKKIIRGALKFNLLQVIDNLMSCYILKLESSKIIIKSDDSDVEIIIKNENLIDIIAKKSCIVLNFIKNDLTIDDCTNNYFEFIIDNFKTEYEKEQIKLTNL